MLLTLDTDSGHQQVEVDNESGDKTSFTFHHGLYQFTRILFVLKNPSATFEHMIDV